MKDWADIFVNYGEGVNPVSKLLGKAMENFKRKFKREPTESDKAFLIATVSNIALPYPTLPYLTFVFSSDAKVYPWRDPSLTRFFD